MKVKLLLLLLLLLACAVLSAKSTEGKLTLDSIWVYSDFGAGMLKDKAILSLEGGVSYELNHEVCFTIYKVIHKSDHIMFSGKPGKYRFNGQGVQIGPVFHKGKFKLIPSAGIEFGAMKTSVFLEFYDEAGNPSPGHYVYVTEEILPFWPISVVAKYNLNGLIGLHGKLSVNISERYPLYRIGLGFSLGRL